MNDNKNTCRSCSASTRCPITIQRKLGPISLPASVAVLRLFTEFPTAFALFDEVLGAPDLNEVQQHLVLHALLQDWEPPELLEIRRVLLENDAIRFETIQELFEIRSSLSLRAVVEEIVASEGIEPARIRDFRRMTGLTLSGLRTIEYGAAIARLSRMQMTESFVLNASTCLKQVEYAYQRVFQC